MIKRNKRFERTLKEEAKEQVIDTIDTFSPEIPYAERTAKRVKKVYDSR